MTHLKDGIKQNNHQQENDDTTTALLLFHDDLNNFLFVIGFYCDSVATFSEHRLQGTDYYHRGIAETGKCIIREGHSLSQRLGVIRQQFLNSPSSNINTRRTPDQQEV